MGKGSAPRKLANERFADHWTAIEPLGLHPEFPRRGILWLFVSDCGESRKLVAGTTRSLKSMCGRCGGKTSNLDLKGLRFADHWTGLTRRRDTRTRRFIWTFESDCGIFKELFTGHRDTLPHYCTVCKDGWLKITETPERRKSFGRRESDRGLSRIHHVSDPSEKLVELLEQSQLNFSFLKEISQLDRASVEAMNRALKEMTREFTRREKVLLKALEKARQKVISLKEKKPKEPVIRRKLKPSEFVPGDVVGHFTVLELEKPSHAYRHFCRCDCGNETYVSLTVLRKSPDPKCGTCRGKAQMKDWYDAQEKLKSE